MPTRKIVIPDNGKKNIPCYDPEHNIPNMMFFEPGTYEHICPTCGNRIRFIVPKNNISSMLTFSKALRDAVEKRR